MPGSAAGPHDGPSRRRRGVRLAALVTLIGLAGCLIIASVTRGGLSAHHFHARQSVWLLCGLATLALVFSLPRQALRRLAIAAGLASYLALLGVLLFGTRINGMRGWYQLGSLCLQPSEIAKPFFILGFAWFIARRAPMTPNWRHFGLAIAYASLWMIPIMLQPDWGTTLIFGASALVLICAIGSNWQQLALLVGGGLAGLLLVCAHTPYVLGRFLAFLGLGSPELVERVGWQASQMRNCFITGGWTGTLFAGDEAALLLVPYRYNDSFFACAAELLGVFGILPLLLLALGWLGYCCYRAQHSRNAFAYAVYIGAGFMLSGQAFIHLAVNLGVMPTTGVTLPLLSYGGSSLLSSILLLAMVEHLAGNESAHALIPPPSAKPAPRL